MIALTKTVIFITGPFISQTCWDEWIQYFEGKGYQCSAPAWPFKDRPAEELRNRPSNDPIASNTIASLTDHFTDIIRALPEKPIIIGHSLGGLIVQLLLQKNLALAGVAVHSFPPLGNNRLRLSFIKAFWEAMMAFTSDEETYLISFRKWNYTIANGLTCEQQKQFYYQYAIPESKKVIRDTLKCSIKIDFRKSHLPILFTSGSRDKLIPPSLNYSNYKKYTMGHMFASYKEFIGHNHLVFGQSAWMKEADFILYWLEGINL